MAGTRRDYGKGATFDSPADPLCTECFEMLQRVWGDTGSDSVSLCPVGPSVIYSEHDPEGRDPGMRRLCPRCGGKGVTPWGSCFDCMGERWVYVFLKGVRREARWSQTYQQNRQPPRGGDS
jgi:hypothetical protein